MKKTKHNNKDFRLMQVEFMDEQIIREMSIIFEYDGKIYTVNGEYNVTDRSFPLMAEFYLYVWGDDDGEAMYRVDANLPENSELVQLAEELLKKEACNHKNWDTIFHKNGKKEKFTNISLLEPVK